MKNGLIRFSIVILCFFTITRVISRNPQSLKDSVIKTKATAIKQVPQNPITSVQPSSPTQVTVLPETASKKAPTTMKDVQKKIRKDTLKYKKKGHQELQGLPSERISTGKQPTEDEASWSLETAAAGAAERLSTLTSYGWGKVKGFSEGIRGSYKSSYGTATKLGVGVAAAALFPYFGPAAALTYLTGLGLTTGAATFVGGSVTGISVYALSSAFDKLEHRYATGNWTDDTAVNAVKGLLEVALSDSGAYPYYQAKIEVLGKENELSLSATDKGSLFSLIVKRACENLAKDYTDTFNKLQDVDKKREKDFMTYVYKLREGNNCNKPSEAKNEELLQYIKALGEIAALSTTEKEPDFLIRYQAILSEYNRALKIKELREQSRKSASKPELAETDLSKPVSDSGFVAN